MENVASKQKRIESRQSIEENNTPQGLFCEKINEMDKNLARLIKGE